MFGGYPESKNRFKIFLRDGMENRFKASIPTFDPDIKIKNKLTYFVIETTIDEAEIRGFTYVKKVVKLNFLEED